MSRSLKRVYRQVDGNLIHQVCRQDLTELALADEGVTVDQREVNLSNVMARTSRASSHRQKCR
jgi:hypothetical protein